MAHLRKSIFLRIVPGELLYGHPEEVYLPKAYGNRNECEQLFEGVEHVYFLHSCYADKLLLNDNCLKTKDDKQGSKEIEKKRRTKRQQELKKWRHLFSVLGVNTLLQVKKDPETEMFQGPSYTSNVVTKKRVWNKSETQWSECEWQESNKGYYIYDDWTSSNFVSFCSKLDQLNEDLKLVRTKKLITLLDEHWDTYKRYRTCRYYHRYYNQFGWSNSETLSTFILSLRNTAWVPTKQNTLEKPTSIFVDKPETRALLGNSVQYLNVQLKNEEFMRDIGVCQFVNVDYVLRFVENNIEELTAEKSRLEKIYSFLDANFLGYEEKIRSSFEKNALVFIPDTKKVVSTKDVFWIDVSDIFGDSKSYLKKYYGSLKEFFVNKLLVSERPAFRDYADLLLNLSRKDLLDDRSREIVVKIYEELNFGLDTETADRLISEEEWWDEFTKKSILLTEKMEFLKNDNGQVLIADSPRLHGIFRNEPKIAFLDLRKDYNPDKIALFARALDLRYLSQSVKKDPVDSGSVFVKCDEITRKVRKLSGYVIRYLYWKDYEKYKILMKNGLLQGLRHVEVYSVDNLLVNFSICLNDNTIVSTTEKDVSVLFQNKFLISKEYEESMDYVAVEFSRLFGVIRGLDSFAISICDKKSEEQCEHLMRLLDIGEVPDSELSSPRGVCTIHFL